MHNLQNDMPQNDHKNQNYPSIQNMVDQIRTDQYGNNNHSIVGNDNIGTSNLNNLTECFNQNPTPHKNYNPHQTNMYNMFPSHSQNHNNPSPSQINRNQQSPYPNSVNDAVNVTNFYGKMNQGDTSSENDTKSEDIRGSSTILQNKFKDHQIINHAHRQMYSSEDNIQNQASILNDFKTKTNQMSKSISNVTSKQDSLNFKFPSNNPYIYLNPNQTGRTSAPPITTSNENKAINTRPRPSSKLLGRPVNGYQRINRRYQNNQDDQHWYSLTIQGKVKNLSPKLWSFTHMTKLDMKGNNIRVLPDDICKLKNLFILDVSDNSIRTLPSTLGDLLELRELNVSHNKIKTLPPALGRLFNLKSLAIEGNEIDSRVMDLRNLSPDNPTQVLITDLFELYFQQNSAKLSEEMIREWISLGPNDFPSDPINLSVMTYNILCDKLATRIQFPYCPPWALNWNLRSSKMLKEIQHYLPDIVCLQELEKRAYKNQFLHFLSSGQDTVKYESVYSQKSRAHNMGFEQKEYVDGCAIFYKSELLKPLLEYTVDFNSLACKVVEGCEYRDQLVNRMASKDNIGLITLFEYHPRPDNQIPYYIVIVNAHLHWDPEFSDIKILQTILLTNAIHKVRVAATSEIVETNEDGTSVHIEPELNEDENLEFKGKNRDEDLDTDKIKMKHTHQSKILIGQKPESIPVIIAGDFNSTPTSAVTDYMVEGKVDMSHGEFNNYSFPKHFNKLTQNKYERVHRINAEKTAKKKKRSEKFLGDINNNREEENLENVLMHPLNLKSAYELDCLETPFTNYTYEFVDMIDYIFYTQDNLTLAGRLKGISRNWFEQRKIPGCPFVGVPSDHLCLLAEFTLKNTRNNKVEMMSRSDTINTNVLSNMTDHHSNDQNLINASNMHNGTNSPHHGSLSTLNNINNFRDLLLTQSNSHGSAVLNGTHGNPASPRLSRIPNNYLSNNDNFMASNGKTNRHQVYNNRW